MPIAPLPQDTVRLLRAHVVISTPVSIVKELLDNSIDAKATSIEVVVSRNTVDRIEVRDNGVGIETRDFEALGRRGHTSKLKSADELESIGGTFLGFRGEALAAMAAVAKVTVTTRTAADDTATVFDLLANGKGTLKHSIKSTPVGTTVTATDMFERLPVRKKVAIKEANLTMAKMKQLLTAYALARPRLKLSIKEMGMAHPCLSYSPRPDATMKAAAMCLLGLDLVAHCGETIHRTDASTKRRNLASSIFGEPANQYVGDVEIIALLPAQGFDPVKISNKGAFFSVDSRPMSSSRTVFKKIYARFKKCIAKCLETPGNGKQVKEPFIALNIKCPHGSYDVNLEPAKDDVLFANEQSIIDASDALFEKTYGLSSLQGEVERTSKLSPVSVVNSEENMASINILSKNGSMKAGGIDFSSSLVQPFDTPHQESGSGDTGRALATLVKNASIKQTTLRDGAQWSVSMMDGESSDDEGSLPTQKQPAKQMNGTIGLCVGSESTVPTSHHQEEDVSRPLEGVNPWMLAKMNAAIKQKQINESHPVPPDPPDSTRTTLQSQIPLREPQFPRPELAPGQALWDKTPASDAPISPPRFPAVRDLEFTIFGQSPVLSPMPAHPPTHGNLFRSPLPSGNQERWKSSSPSPTGPQQAPHPESNYQTPPSSSGADQRSRGERSNKRGGALRGGGQQLRQSKLFSRNVWKPNRPKGDSESFVPNLRNPEPNGSGDLMPPLVSPELWGKQPQRLLLPSQQNSRDGAPSDLIVRGRQNPRKEPSGRSFAAATKPFSPIISIGAPIQPEITTGRAFLQCEASPMEGDMPNHEMSSRPATRRRSRSRSGRRSKRLKSSILALETATLDTLGLEIWKEKFDFNLLLALEERLSVIDDYLMTGDIHEGLLINQDTLGGIEAQLKSILYDHLVDEDGQRCDCEIDLRRAMVGE
ncbi:hypothetical protein PpBr36_05407 [Pyricularia pennisetigena]|uniref:hypothetical protein n=1 Tax=Pyricularia pennisetigena TaxID=1578925 RepID=UPI0011507CBB|nr:hypothetical protein PpBr36_05407 [Pyricularia pennisetigena]TLS27620.1 hypothetical protein PpBr36_05407 [Pyricularia pennisetigena]